MARQKVPRYHGIRIYILSPIMYFFLVFPFMIFLGIKNLPKVAGDRDPQLDSLVSDTLLQVTDAKVWLDEEKADSMINELADARVILADSIIAGAEETGADKEEENGRLFREQGPFSRYMSLFFFAWLASLVAGWIFNYPMKRYLRRLRASREPGEKLLSRSRHRIFFAPLVNAFIVTFPNLLIIIFSITVLAGMGQFEDDVERQMFVEMFYLTLVASLLEFLFVYYWIKHRVHIRYIEHIFTAEELKTSIFKGRKGKIRNRFMVASSMTTFLPLIIVMFYLVLSITSVKELGMESLTPQQREILIGPWEKFFTPGQESYDIEKYEWLFYVDAGNSLLMIIGIANGVLASLLYLILFIRWTNKDLTRPLKELLANMRNTRGGEEEQYALVRSNDEIGELAAGYNEMTRQIHEHVSQIKKMNRDLEQTVKERTREVVLQKEEIEAQKEEIEAQLDLTTLQRDTISNQKEQILDSIRYAQRIQSAMLPPDAVLKELLGEFFLIFKPRDIVSGDFFWLAEKNGKTCIAVADCTGHGVPGAFLSVLGITSLNEILNRSSRLHAGRILEQLRNYLVKTLHQSGAKGEANDGIEISLVILDPGKKKLQFAGANRPIYMARKDGRIEYTRGDRMPIGIYEQNPGPFTNHTISYREGDSMYLFSDGYVDQLGGTGRKTFRVVHFRKLLAGIMEKDMQEQKGILLQKHLEWKGEVDQIDDILVLGIRL